MKAQRSELAAVLLLLAVVRFYGWTLAPAELAGVASKGLGGVAILGLLWLMRGAYVDRLTWCVAGWWICNEFMVAGCSGAWMLQPWHVPKGVPMCSAWIGIDIGAITAVFVALLALAVSICSSTNTGGRHNAG